MNQLERARAAFLAIADAVEQNHTALAIVVGLSQNDPPEGQSDGSIDEEVWELLAKASRAADDIQLVRERLRVIASTRSRL